MYRYLDRPLEALHPHDRLLVVSMRQWVRAVAVGRCPCTAAQAGFRYEGVEIALGDFNMAMAVLNGDALATVRFAAPGADQVGEDEARLLAMFATGVDGAASQVQRLAGQLVQQHAIGTLATAIGRVAAVMTAIDPRRPNVRREEI